MDHTFQNHWEVCLKTVETALCALRGGPFDRALAGREERGGGTAARGQELPLAPAHLRL